MKLTVAAWRAEAAARSLARGWADEAMKTLLVRTLDPAGTPTRVEMRIVGTARVCEQVVTEQGSTQMRQRVNALLSRTSKKSPRKPVARVAAKPALLAGGNPRIAKADGDAPVQAYIAAMPGWKRDVGRRLDALIVRNVPGVRKAVRWNSPLYGIEGQGWFLGFHVFTHYVKVTFFRGTSLRPGPPGGTSKDARWIDIHEDDLDVAQMATWIRQAAAVPGWGKA
jgi:hypothetical protein